MQRSRHDGFHIVTYTFVVLLSSGSHSIYHSPECSRSMGTRTSRSPDAGVSMFSSVSAADSREDTVTDLDKKKTQHSCHTHKINPKS